MTDIVERLRQDAEAGLNGMGFDALSDLEREAAEEIERLRKTLDDHLESEAAETRRADRERDRARKAEAEIERLRGLVQDLTDQRDIFARTLTKRDGELEQLREALRAVISGERRTKDLLDLVNRALGDER